MRNVIVMPVEREKWGGGARKLYAHMFPAAVADEEISKNFVRTHTCSP